MDKEETKKLEKICAILKQDTLDPAISEAKQLIEVAKSQASQIIQEAEITKAQLLAQAENSLNKERSLFEQSIKQASKQTLETLRQNIEENFFNPALKNILIKEARDPQLIAKILEALIHQLDKSGLNSNRQVELPKDISIEAVLNLLSGQIKNEINEKTCQIGNFQAGAEIKVVDKHLTVKMSEQALYELFISFIRKDLREFMFNFSKDLD